MWGVIVDALMCMQGGDVGVEFIDPQLRVVVQPLVYVWPMTEQRRHAGSYPTCDGMLAHAQGLPLDPS